MNPIKIIILAFHFFPLILGGYIHHSQTEILYQNVKFAQNFTFVFSLESGLSSTDYFYFKFPFSLGDSIFSSNPPTASLSLLFDSSNSNEVFYSAIGGSYLNYFFNFNQDVQKNTWYRLKIMASASSILLQTEGFQGIVELYTVSSILDNRIYYDSNPIFDTIQFAPTPRKEISGNCSIDLNSLSLFNNPDAVFPVYFDLLINDDYKYGSTFQFSMNDGSFNFLSGLTILSCTPGVDLPLCYYSSSTNNIKSNNSLFTKNEVDLTILNPIKGGMAFRIMTSIKNPSIITQGTSTSYIIVRQVSSIGTIIINMINLSCGLQVNQLSILSNIIQLFWGLESTSLTNSAGCPIVLYTLPASPNIIPWNSIKLTFVLSKKTPLSLPLSIKVDLTTSFQDILLGSISTNAPILSNAMKCQVLMSQYLQCSNFSNLQSSNSYFISFKITIKNGISSSLTIGGIQLIDMSTTVQYTNLLYPSNSLPVLTNNEYIDTAAAGVNAVGAGYPNMNYNQMISYDDTTMTYNFGKADSGLGIGDIISGSPSSQSSIKYPTATQATQKIIFFLQVSSSQLCQNLANRCSTTSANADHTMMKIVFNNNIMGISSTNFPKGIELINAIFADVLSATTINYCANGGWCSAYNTYSSQTSKINQIFLKTASSSTYNNYHHLTVVCQTPAAASQKQCHHIVGRAAIYGSSMNVQDFSGFAFRGVTISTYPSYYVDNYVFDFILCFKYQSYMTSGTANVASTDESTWTLSTAGVIPGYIITKGFYKSNMRVSWINYAGKSGVGISSDNYLPFILRVGGFFSSSYDSPSSFSGNMAVIFIGSTIDLSAFKEGSPTESATDTITCGNSNGTNLLGRIYPRVGSVTTQTDVWTNEARIELDYNFTDGNYFNFYIPVKPTYVSNVLSSLNSLSIAVVTKNSNNVTINGVFRLVGSVDHNSYSMATMTQDSQSFSVNTGFWAGVGANFNCINGGSSPGLDSSITLKPLTTYSTSFKISTSIGSNANINCLNNQEGSQQNGWGTAFTMASDINIFSSLSSISWDFDGVVNDVTTNICVYFSYNLPNANKRIYTIVCPVDTYSGISSPTIGGTYKYLQLNEFVWPWWWGDSSMPSNLIRYGWSRSDGVLVAYRSENMRVYSQSLCVNSDLYFYPNTSYTKYGLYITPGIIMTVNSTTNLNQFFLRMFVNSTTLPHVLIEGCEFLYGSNKFGCLATTYTNYVDFYITYNGATSLTLDQNYWIYFYLSNDGIPFQDYYYFQIYSPSGYYTSNFLIDTCNYAAFKVNLTASPLIQNFSLSNVSFMPCRDSLTSFTFTLDTLGRNLYKGVQVVINLGFLTMPVIGNYDLRCRVYEGANISVLSYKWSLIQFISPDTLILTPKYDIFNDFVFSVHCYGLKGPSLMRQSLSFSGIINKIGSQTFLQISNNITANTNVSQPYPFQYLSFTKNMSYIGLEANYFFKFELYRGQIDNGGRILISFPKNMPSLLNSFGYFKCYLNTLAAACELIDENLLSISPNLLLDYKSNQIYSLDIYGIQQPNVTKSSLFLDNTIAFMVDNDTNLSNGIVAYGELSDNFTYMTNSLTFGIGILDLNISKNTTRDISDIFMRLRLGAGAIITGNTIYVKLDVAFSFSLIGNNSLTCSLYNEIDSNYTNNFINTKCYIVDLLKIQMTVNATDPNNSLPQIYQLFVRNLPTPIDFMVPANPLIEVFYTLPASVTQVYRTSSGFMNSTFPNFIVSNSSVNMHWFYYDSSNDSYVLHNSTYLDVYIGRYTTKIGLGLFDGIFNLTYNYTLQTNDSSIFLTYPSYSPAVVKAVPYNGFYIAGAKNATAGIYYLSFAKFSGGDQYNWTSPIPPLIINLRAVQCQINTAFAYYEIPIGKTSFPMYLDFHNCIPLENVTISANISFGFKEYNIYLVDDNNQFVQTLNQTVKFQPNVYPQISFILRNQDVYQNLTANLSGIVTFQVYGSNADSFMPPNPIQAKLVESISFKTPPIPSIPKVQTYANTVGVTIKCSQPSQIFYSLRTIPFETTFSYKLIQAQTYSVNIYQTQLNFADPSWAIYGFTLQNSYNSMYLNISDLRANAKYYFCFFCLNRFGVISPIGPNTSWVQPDNQGRISKISFTFNNSISSLLVNEIACSLTQIFSVTNLQVQDSNGTSCSLQRRILTNNITNNTNQTQTNITTNQTTNITISQTTNITTNKTKYVFFIFPNYQLAIENLQIYVNFRIVSIGALKFGNLVLSNTGKQSMYPALLNLTNTIFYTPQIYVPKAIITKLNTTNSSIFFNLSLNTSGFIAIAISSNYSLKPTAANLKKGVDKYGNKFQIWEVLNFDEGEVFLRNYSKVNSSTLYYLWHTEWNDDSSILANFGGLNEISVRTNATKLSSFGEIVKTISFVFIWIILSLIF